MELASVPAFVAQCMRGRVAFGVDIGTVPEFYEALGILKAIFASGDKMLKVCPRFERVHSCSVLEKWKKTSYLFWKSGNLSVNCVGKKEVKCLTER